MGVSASTLQPGDAHREIVYEYGGSAKGLTQDAFGNAVLATGPLAQENTYRFSTKQIDSETGFYDFGYRPYLPETGRWVSRDPSGEIGGINLYLFALNAPQNWTDFLGLWVEGSKIITPGTSVQRVQQTEQTVVREIEERVRGLNAVAQGVIRAEKNSRCLYRLGRVTFDPQKEETSAYVFTCKYGWIDLGHFFNSATVGYAVDAETSYAAGVAYEVFQNTIRRAGDAIREVVPVPPEYGRLTGQSAYTPEDLVSDWEGAAFGDALRRRDFPATSASTSFANVASEWQAYLRASGAVNPDAAGAERLRSGADQYWSGKFYMGPRYMKREEAIKFMEQITRTCDLCDGDRPKPEFAY